MRPVLDSSSFTPVLTQENMHIKTATLPTPLLPKQYLWYSLLFEAEQTRGEECDQKDWVNENFQ
jgi:hypothetical protein